jgi:hypothetical protein
MKTRIHNITAVLVTSSVLASCASPQFTAKQAAALPSTHVAMPSKTAKAYHKPIHVSRSSQMAGGGAAGAAGAAGGVAGALLGAIIVAGIQSADQNGFEKTNAGPLAGVEQPPFPRPPVRPPASPTAFTPKAIS